MLGKRLRWTLELGFPDLAWPGLVSMTNGLGRLVNCLSYGKTIRFGLSPPRRVASRILRRTSYFSIISRIYTKMLVIQKQIYSETSTINYILNDKTRITIIITIIMIERKKTPTSIENRLKLFNAKAN